MAHRHLDAWLDQLAPVFDQERPPTLLELSELFTRTRVTLLGGCLQVLTEELYAESNEGPVPSGGDFDGEAIAFWRAESGPQRQKTSIAIRHVRPPAWSAQSQHEWGAGVHTPISSTTATRAGCMP